MTAQCRIAPSHTVFGAAPCMVTRSGMGKVLWKSMHYGDGGQIGLAHL